MSVFMGSVQFCNIYLVFVMLYKTKRFLISDQNLRRFLVFWRFLVAIVILNVAAFCLFLFEELFLYRCKICVKDKYTECDEKKRRDKIENLNSAVFCKKKC